MKTIILLLSIMMFFSPLTFAQSAKKVGKEIITAYKEKDIKAVKKHATPIIVMTMGKKFFENKKLKKSIKHLKKWDGKIKEVRYFATVFGAMATVYYADAKEKGKIRIFVLNKFKDTWKEGIGGFDTIDKAEFLTLSKKEVAKKKRKKKSKTSANKSYKGYSIEMAEGGIIKNPSINKLKKALASLSDDNFFLTLNGPKGFMQASFSKKGLDIQYKNETGHFTGEDFISKEKATSIFIDYIQNTTGWKNKCQWKPFEY